MNTSNARDGHLIADRYELTAQLDTSFAPSGVSTWLAVDTILSQQVRAVVIDADHPQRAQILDAARKASLFHDANSVAILRVVDDARDAAILTELPLGKPLVRILDAARATRPASPAVELDSSTTTLNGPTSNTEKTPVTLLPAEAVQALIGQLTSTINLARHLGIRQLYLSPELVYVTDAQQVIVDGLGYAAVMNNIDLKKSVEELDRAEALNIASFAAQLLVDSKHSQPSDDESVDARHESDAEFALSSQAEAIEAALEIDALPEQLRDVLALAHPGAGDAGAKGSAVDADGNVTSATASELGLPQLSTPGEIVRLLVPWQNTALEQLPEPLTHADSTQLVTSGADDAANDPATATGGESSTNFADDAFADASFTSVIFGDEDEPLSTHLAWPSPFDTDADMDSEVGDEAGEFGDTHLYVEELSADSDETSASAGEMSASAGVTSAGDGETETTLAAVAEPASAATADLAALAPNSNSADAVMQDAREFEAADAAATESTRRGQSATSRLMNSVSEITALPATVRADNNEVPDKNVNGSRFVLIGFAVLLFIAFIAGIFSLFKPLSPVTTVDPDTGKTIQQSDSTTTGTPNDATTPSTTPAAPEVTIVTPTIGNVEAVAQDATIFTSNGESSANLLNSAGNATDGDASTFWRTWWYRNATSYENNKLGLKITLKEEATVSEVTLNTKSEGGKVIIKQDAGGDIASGPNLTQGTFSGTTTLKFASPIKLKTFIVLVDQLPTDDEGRNRAVINEITVK